MIVGGGGQKTVTPVYMLWGRRTANRSRFLSDGVLRGKWNSSSPEPASPSAPTDTWKVGSHIFPSPTQFQDNLIFFFVFFGEQNLHPPHLCLHFQFAYQRNPIGTCFAYLHLISNFKRTCQKWSSFLFWMCEDYLACIISASTCNAATKQNKLISNGTRGTFYIGFH